MSNTDFDQSEERWEYLLLNGKSKYLLADRPKFNNGKLTEISGLKPFHEVDENGKIRIPTVDDAERIKRNTYNEFFRKPFKNILVLSGAGSSMDVNGPSMEVLWDKAEETYKVDDGWQAIQEAVNYTSNKKDLEALLSKIDGYLKFVDDKNVRIGEKEIALSIIKKSIFNIIKKFCSIPKPNGHFPHKFLLEKLLQRKQTSPRIKIFTLNYDLLFEYAGIEVNAVIIDGFSFTFPRSFSGRFFDYDIVQREGSKLQEEDNFIERVFHLHKLHGSLNWTKAKNEKDIYIEENAENPLIVYPREAKYEDSYEQPFFEMMARFQRSLRINNDTLLICIGYSFNDKHINAAIEEALNQNPSFRLAIIDPKFNSKEISQSLAVILEVAKQREKVIMISETFMDFAIHFPEIKTYEVDNNETVSLENVRTKN